MLRGIVKSRQRLAGLVRSYASAELAVAEPSQYLRFASPVPQPYNHLQALGSIPETKVWQADSDAFTCMSSFYGKEQELALLQRCLRELIN